MRAVRVDGPGMAALCDLPPPEPGPGEELLDVVATSVCSTDRKLAAQGQGAPVVPGHEIVARRSDGTLVGVHPEVGCGSCQACLAGWDNRCPDRVSIGLQRDGGLAEQMAAPQRKLLPLGGIDPLQATLLEPLACCLHAIDRADVQQGARTVVVGAGAMGILCTWALQQRGATVGVCQRSEPRRRRARELGADAVFGPDEEPQTHLGARPDAVFVTAPGAEPLDWALEHAATGGVVHAFAGSPGGARIDANVVHYRHLSLVGSTGSRMTDYRAAALLVEDGAVDLKALPVRLVPLSAAPGVLLGAGRGEGLKTTVVIEAQRAA